jgi:ankyrin repeat protein
LRKLITEQPQLAADGSSLRLAAANGNVPAVTILVAAGADLKATDPDGLSPLGIALVQHHGDVAELLTKQGATKNIFDAVFSDDAEKTVALIERDKSLVSATNAIGVSLAEIAAACGNEKTLKLLLDRGVSPNYQNPSTGKSLIHAAAAYDRTNTTQMLIQRHAKLDVADNSGFAPLHICALRGSVDVLDLLLKHKVNSNQGTIAANSIPPFGGVEPQARQLAAGGNTALHLAVLAGQTNVIAALLQRGASVNATNAYGMTPLDMASTIGLPPFLLMRSTDMRLPIGSPVSSRENPMLSRSATIALLEQAGGKHGERRGPSGMMPFGQPTMTRFPTMNSAPGPQAPVLQTGADYHAQGCLDYNARRFTNALADFRKSCELGSDNQDYSYFRIWLIRARLGETEAATRELAAYLANRKTGKPDDWPSKVGAFLAGQSSESDFLKAADDPNLQTSKEQHCEAYFYIGSKHLVENDRMAAVDNFKKCLTTNVTNFEEYTSAASELLRLQMPPTNP